MSTEKVILFVCGDVLNKERDDGLICSSELASVIRSADYAVCNFEAPIEGYGVPYNKLATHLSQIEATVKGLKKQGFGLLLLANNHIMDYGEGALTATLKKAAEYQLDTVGAGVDVEEAYKPIVKVINGIKIGILNAGETQHGALTSQANNRAAGYAWINDPKIETNIINLRKECDFIIIFAHAGLEHYPIPQKEWRIKYRHFCNLGADLVIGSHTHCPQGIEHYRESIIFYSLGNFYYVPREGRKMEDSSFSLLLELNKRRGLTYELIHHTKKGDLVHLSTQENRIDIELLNLLIGTDYEIEHERMVLEALDSIKRRLSNTVFLDTAIFGRVKSLFRLIILRMLRRYDIRKECSDLLYILKNESYFYVLKNGIEITRNKNNERGF